MTLQNKVAGPSLRVLVVGLGNMGRSHALAYHRNPGFEIVGLVSRSLPSLEPELSAYSHFTDFDAALTAVAPDLVAIATHTDTHADFAIKAMRQGAHVFVEKPLAASVTEARQVVEVSKQTGRKLVVGYILRHHPSWQRLIAEAKALGGPYVFRMNLNQQSIGSSWQGQKQLMQTTSPIVDCGVHYVDVMSQIADSVPLEVRGMGLRLSNELVPNIYNYGHFQVLFADGSIGWYEAGWGPMMSETAFFVKDVISPNGAVSIVMDHDARSADLDTHTRTSRLRIHHSAISAAGEFVRPDELLLMTGEPDHQELCEREQTFVYQVITEDMDLSSHNRAAILSLEICLAADQSVRTGLPVRLNGRREEFVA